MKYPIKITNPEYIKIFLETNLTDDKAIRYMEKHYEDEEKEKKNSKKKPR